MSKHTVAYCLIIVMGMMPLSIALLILIGAHTGVQITMLIGEILVGGTTCVYTAYRVEDMIRDNVRMEGHL